MELQLESHALRTRVGERHDHRDAGRSPPVARPRAAEHRRARPHAPRSVDARRPASRRPRARSPARSCIQESRPAPSTTPRPPRPTARRRCTSGCATPSRTTRSLRTRRSSSWSQPGMIIGLAMRPHSDAVNIGDAHRTISTGVISHTCHFHERFDVGQWLLVAQEASYAGRGRVFGSGSVFDARTGSWCRRSRRTAWREAWRASSIRAARCSDADPGVLPPHPRRRRHGRGERVVRRDVLATVLPAQGVRRAREALGDRCR